MKKCRVILQVILCALIFFLIGEFNFRLLGIERRVEWKVDENLFSRLKPSQRGYMWIGSMGEKSPPITINRYGLRGNEVNPKDDSFKIISIGSSSAFGVGVKDDETFTARLENIFRNNNDFVSVYNAANPGWGPYHWNQFLLHESKELNPDLILLSVSFGDIAMGPPAKLDRKKEYLEGEKRRKKLLSKSLFLTFSIRKLVMIKERITSKFKRTITFEKEKEVEPLGAGGGRFNNIMNQNDKYFYAIISLCKQKQWPIIIFIRNLKGEKAAQLLKNRLQEITKKVDYGKILEINSDCLNIENGVDVKEYVKKNLEIQFDGHPNKNYHFLMAEYLYSSLKQYYENSPKKNHAKSIISTK